MADRRGREASPVRRRAGRGLGMAGLLGSRLIKSTIQENMREGKREMIGNLDAGNRLRDELVGCIRSGYFRKCRHWTPQNALMFNSPSSAKTRRGTVRAAACAWMVASEGGNDDEAGKSSSKNISRNIFRDFCRSRTRP